MIAFPNAKINLGLNITGKRTDGYHDLESVFYPVAYTDVLELTAVDTEAFELKCTGLEISGSQESNLVWKAWQVLSERYNAPAVHAHLHKSIPMGAGLGGGSADGAFMLSLLNDQCQLGLDVETLESLALELGSDCPFFIRNQAQMVTGRGEIMEPFDLSLAGYWIALVSPNVHIGTAEAYANVAPGPADYNLAEALSTPVNEWRDVVYNQFERSVFPNHPELAAIKEKMYEINGALYVSMTGSGSTVFGIFDRQPILWPFKELRTWVGKLH